MKEILQNLASYNVWSNHKIIYCMQQQEKGIWNQQTESSFDTLFKTVLHMWDAESIWWQRIKLHERILIPSQNFEASFKDACNGLLQQSIQWEEWVKTATDLALRHVFEYRNLKGEPFKQPVSEVLTHLFNHDTYHRGQLVTMLRRLGVATIPGTDFIVYKRSKK